MINFSKAVSMSFLHCSVTNSVLHCIKLSHENHENILLVVISISSLLNRELSKILLFCTNFEI